MRRNVLVLAFAASLLATALLATEPRPAFADDDGSVAVPSGEELEAKTRKRFPGVEAVALVKVLRWPERSPGPCTADFDAGEGATRLDAAWRTAGGETAAIRDGDLGTLAKHGWKATYRTPSGVGFERVEDFEEIDLDLSQSLVCRCFDGKREAERHPSRLRFRWTKGKLPEVSASIGDEPVEGLRPAITAGRLVTYDFPLARRFPGDRGFCGGHVALTILVDPPIL